MAMGKSLGETACTAILGTHAVAAMPVPPVAGDEPERLRKLFFANTADWESADLEGAVKDVTRPSNGCGGCTKAPMKSSNPRQASWRPLGCRGNILDALDTPKRRHFPGFRPAGGNWTPQHLALSSTQLV